MSQEHQSSKSILYREILQNIPCLVVRQALKGLICDQRNIGHIVQEIVEEEIDNILTGIYYT